jgi:hypothetical protein
LLQYINTVIDRWNVVQYNNKDLPLPITTDNAANITKAVKDGGYINVRCFAHMLNLAAKRGLSVIENTVSHVRRIVRYFNKSCAAYVILKEKQKLTDTPEHKLITDCVTRWNSTHDMLQRFREQYNAISSVLYSTNRLNHNDVIELRCHLSKVDCDTIGSILEILKPLKYATTCMCAESRVTISAIHPIKQSITNKMAPLPTDSTLVKNLKLAIANDLSGRYATEKEEQFLLCAMAIDSRFKKMPYVGDEKGSTFFMP